MTDPIQISPPSSGPSRSWRRAIILPILFFVGGIGATAFTAERQDAPLPPQESRTRTFNYGGGARWFSKKHVALSVDLRFYAVSPQLQTAGRPAFSRMTLVAFSVGAAFK